MKLKNFFRRPRKGFALHKEATTSLLHRIYNVLEGLCGEGCYIDKPTDKDGRGWKVVINGIESDCEPHSVRPMPFDLVNIDNSWRVWIREAEVFLDNLPAIRTDVDADTEGQYTRTSYGPGTTVYLVVYVDGGTRRWTLRTSVPSLVDGNAVAASVAIGAVSSLFAATQYTRGQQVLYRLADSEIIGIDKKKCCAKILTDDDSLAPAADFSDNRWTFAVRKDSLLQYCRCRDVARLLADEVEKIVERNIYNVEEPGEEDKEWSENELWWKIVECLRVRYGWPFYQPTPTNGNTFTWRDGWEPTTPEHKKLFGLKNGSWADAESAIEGTGKVLRTDFDRFKASFQAVLSRFAEIAEDPDDLTYTSPPGEDGPLQSKKDSVHAKLETYSALLQQYKNAMSLVGETVATMFAALPGLDSRVGEIEAGLDEAGTTWAGLESQIRSLE